MGRWTWLASTLAVAVAAMHCSPGTPPAKPADLPRVSSTAGGAAECGPGYAACKHTSIGVEELCYGTDPGPNAPRQRRACTCDECLDDGECGGGRRCYLDRPSCGVPQHLCVDRCKQGACAENFQCGDGFCVPRPRGGPP